MEEVFRDELVLTVVPEHPWARQGKISIERTTQATLYS